MNAVLEQILADRKVSDGTTEYPLGHYHVDVSEGELLQAAVRATSPKVSLEVGMAYGISTLFICEVLAEQKEPATHIVIDPFQRSDWHGVGLRNVHEAGYERLVSFREAPSEAVLPQLLQDGTTLDFALIDGWHSFDQALVEFYYINRMLRVGGIVVFDDADWPMLHRLMRYIVAYPSYRVFGRDRVPTSSALGAIRRRLVRAPMLARLLHPTLVNRAWDLGLDSTCVALVKVAEDERPMTWVAEF